MAPFWQSQIASGLHARGSDPAVHTAWPRPHRSVVADGRDHLAVAAERYGVDTAGVAGQRLADRVAGGPIPQPHWPVVAGGGDRLAVWAEGHARGAAGVADQGLADRLAGGAIPQPHRLVVPGGGDHLSVGAEGHTV